jgi:hypothetical protein
MHHRGCPNLGTKGLTGTHDTNLVVTVTAVTAKKYCNRYLAGAVVGRVGFLWFVSLVGVSTRVRGVCPMSLVWLEL